MLNEHKIFIRFWSLKDILKTVVYRFKSFICIYNIIFGEA